MATGHLIALFPHGAQAGGSSPATGAVPPAVTPQKGQYGGGARGWRGRWGAHPPDPLLFPLPSVPHTSITTHPALSGPAGAGPSSSPKSCSPQRLGLRLPGPSSCGSSIRRRGRAGLGWAPQCLSSGFRSSGTERWPERSLSAWGPVKAEIPHLSSGWRLP